jgi:hypothetical protein
MSRKEPEAKKASESESVQAAEGISLPIITVEHNPSKSAFYDRVDHTQTCTFHFPFQIQVYTDSDKIDQMVEGNNVAGGDVVDEVDELLREWTTVLW